MSDPIVYEDPEGERALARDMTELRRRRWITRVGVSLALVIVAGILLWPPSPCEQLAQEVCTGGFLHCGRSRDAIKSSLERSECEALLKQFENDDRRGALRVLEERFPDARYTEAERQQIRDNPKRLP